MRKKFRKILALALSLCTLLALTVPTVSAAETDTASEGFVFPEYGETLELGQPLLGDMALTEYAELVEYNNQQFVAVPAKGGRLYIFNLTYLLNGYTNSDGNYIHDWAFDGIGIPRGIVQNSKGTVYVVGDSSSVFYYDIPTGRSGKIRLPGSSGNTGVTVDEDDNVYVSGKSSSGAVVHRINGTNHAATLIYSTSDFTTAQTIVWGGNRLYIEGPFRNGAGTGAEIRELTELGKFTRSIALPNTGGVYYLSYVGGVAFLGHSGTVGDGLVAVDTTGANLERLDLGKTASIMGAVTNEKNGKAYMVLSGDGVYEYNVKSKTLGSRISTAGSRNLRVRSGYVTHGSGEYILTMSTSAANFIRISGSGSAPSLGNLFDGAYSSYTPRTMGPGVPGTGVAVYVGGYLTSRVASYTPGTEESVENRVFSNGHAQTDSLIAYNGKVYGGAYSGAYLFEYDPSNRVFTELIHGLKDKYEQLRIHSLAAGDNKIFFSTVPGDGKYGGCIGWYDLTDGTYYCERNVVQDQILISITYDEATGLLYGASCTRGGTNTSTKAEQAVLLVYDVANKKSLGQYPVESLTGDKPKFISGIAQDPDTGKFWGLVSQTVFSFEYKDGEMTITEEWEAPTVPTDRYSNYGSKSWFPRAILFDGRGGMYIGMDEEAYGMMKFTLGSDGKIAKAVTLDSSTSRVYTMGADGNLYIYDTSLRMITLSRAEVVKEMIDATRLTDKDGIAQIRLAYESLTEKEKEQLSGDYYDRLLMLESGEEALEPAAVEKAIAAIDKLKALTITSGSDLLEARMAYDALKDSGKAKVTNYQKLVESEAAYAAICENTVWGDEKHFDYQLNKGSNERVGDTALTEITFGHITGGTWEYAAGTEGTAMDFSGNDCIRLELSGNGWIALRIKVSEAGLYDLEMERSADQGCLGGVYLFPATGADNGWKQTVKNEMGLGVAYTEHYIGSVDYAGSGTVTVGKWQCDVPGEYILALNCLAESAGSYASPMRVTLSKRDPVPDDTVELVKNRINSIGTITENSGNTLQQARITYDSLTDAQKGLIYAELLTQLEAEYAKFQEAAKDQAVNDAAIALVQVQINAIGAVTEDSGGLIQAAREAFDALTPEQQAGVANADVLVKAEADFAALTAGGSGMIIAIIVVVLVVIAGAAAVVLLKKKKAAVGAIHESPEISTP